MAIERREFTVDELNGWEYGNPASEELTIALHGLMRSASQKQGTIDQIASSWAAARDTRVLTFDATGSFANFHRVLDGQEAPFTFTQYIQDACRVTRHGVITARERRVAAPLKVNFIGYSFGGTVATHAIEQLQDARQELNFTMPNAFLLETPVSPRDHKKFKRYKPLKIAFAQKNYLLLTEKDESGAMTGIRFSKTFLDDYTQEYEEKEGQESHRTVAQIEKIVASGTQVYYAASLADKMVDPKPILALKNTRAGLKVEEVPEVPHDTTDPEAIGRLVKAALRRAAILDNASSA